jgi:hypothetical protein
MTGGRLLEKLLVSMNVSDIGFDLSLFYRAI